MSHVILFCPKHSNLWVFWCNSLRNHANRQSKTCEDFRKIMNEDSRGLERHYKGRNYVPRSEVILYGSKHSRRQRDMHLGTGLHSHAPRAWSIFPEQDHALQTSKSSHSCTPSMGHAPRTWRKSGQNWFLLVFSGKNPVFKPNSRWKLSL